MILRAVVLIFTSLYFGIANADTVTINCDYRYYSDKDGHYPVDGEFKLTFLYDKENDQAYIMGNNGSSRVTHFRQSDSMSFVEVTGTGNVMTTTIAEDLSSVHSRNSVMFGKLLASQYYGSCRN
jgi:hypothetical protein